jgi:lipopolysaccharide transport system ATP-binding protein
VHKPRERLHAFTSLLMGHEPREGVEVLSGITLEVRKGQSLGIIGENGAGKSTLLKILTGVIKPTQGKVNVRGTTAALLELGAGFQPDFSGIDNVRMKASLLGIGQRELDSRMDEILAFADIGDYIYEPVKHYSSGMVVRLGFAVVAASQPDLLITDEVLAVGDESFQKKCIRWIDNFLEDGGTLLLVSHSMYVVQKLCRQALWLQDGKVSGYGEVHRVTQDYLAWHERRQSREDAERRLLDGTAGRYGMLDLALHNAEGAPCTEYAMQEDLRVDLSVHSPDGRAPVAMVGLVRADGTPIFGVSTQAGDGRGAAGPVKVITPAGSASAREYHYSIQFNRLELLPGRYLLRGHVMDPEGLRVCDTLERELRIRGESTQFGMVRLDHQWLGPQAQALPEPDSKPVGRASS